MTILVCKKEKSKWEEAAIRCLRIEWSSVKALKAMASIEGVIYCERTRNVTSGCTHCNQQLISVTTCHSVFTVTVFLIAPQLTFNYSALLFYLIGIYQCLASSSSSPTIRFFPVFCQFLKKMEIESVLCEKSRRVSIDTEGHSHEQSYFWKLLFKTNKKLYYLEQS